MKINITGRHFEITDDLAKYAEKKLVKLGKFFHKPASMNVIMFMEKYNHIIEAVVEGDGNQFIGTEKANDMYSSVDLLMKSLEKQIVRNKEKHTGHKVMPLSKTIRPEPASDDSVKVIINQIERKPKGALEAFLEMKIDNRDFILFNKNLESNGSNDITHAVIFKAENGFKMAERSGDKKKKNRKGLLSEFDLIIRNDSIKNPKIKFKKCGAFLKHMDVNNAVREILQKGDFLPFFNNETDFLNVICKNKNNVELITPVI